VTRVLERTAGSLLEAVLRRVDPAVAGDEHRDCARSILAKLARDAVGDAPSGSGDAVALRDRLLSSVVERHRAMLGEASPEPRGGAPGAVASEAVAWIASGADLGTPAYETPVGAQVVHLLGLGGWDEGATESSGPLDALLRHAVEKAAFGAPKGVADPERLVPAQLTAALLPAAFAGRRVGGDALAGALETLTASLEPRRWFLRKGAFYGTAGLLRGLLRHPEASAADYTRDVCERLLRHVELRGHEALPFRPETLPSDAAPEVERARYGLALVEASRRFGDLRYLNAAIKMADLRHWDLRRRAKRSRSSLLVLHHAAAVALQERTMQEELGS